MSGRIPVSLTGRNVGDKNLQERLSNVGELQQKGAKGIAGDPLYEPIPQLIKTSTEKVIENGSGANIVLGKDRFASRLSGYGGAGNTQAGSIDIVVGRMGADASSFSSRGGRVWVDPDFSKDAARIYISQKTDIDANFNLADGRVGHRVAKSGIGLKADEIRLVSRGGIKLVTKVDGETSQGDNNLGNVVGVDLIAANSDDDIQPIPKGDNLRDALNRLTHHVEKLNGIVDSLLMYQMTFNTALTHHFHFSPFFGLPTTPSPPVVAAGMSTMINHSFQTKRSLIMHKANTTLFKFKYFSPAGEKFINSRHHHLN